MSVPEEKDLLGVEEIVGEILQGVRAEERCDAIPFGGGGGTGEDFEEHGVEAAARIRVSGCDAGGFGRDHGD